MKQRAAVFVEEHLKTIFAYALSRVSDIFRTLRRRTAFKQMQGFGKVHHNMVIARKLLKSVL